MTPRTLPSLRIDDPPLNFVRTILWKNLLRTVTPLRYRTLSNYLAQHVSVGYIPLAACGLLRTWPPKAPGNSGSKKSVGAAAVVEVAGRAFTATQTDKKQWALCLDPLTGETLWQHLLFPKENRHFAKGPVTSPVVDEDRVYYIPYAIYKKDVWEMRVR